MKIIHANTALEITIGWSSWTRSWAIAQVMRLQIPIYIYANFGKSKQLPGTRSVERIVVREVYYSCLLLYSFG
jgi:hypothetical protein